MNILNIRIINLTEKSNIFALLEKTFISSQFYKEQLSELTKGRGVFLTERAGYQQNTGEIFTQARKPDDRLDKTRHLFDKAYDEIGNEGHQSGMKFM